MPIRTGGPDITVLQQGTELATGNIYYVDASMSDDTGNGLTPGTAKQTIGAALALVSACDHIVVACGTYTETGLDLDTNSVSMEFKSGVTIDPASGTALTISGNYCTITGLLNITPAADEIGINITGTNAFLQNIIVVGSASGNGIVIAGTDCELVNCRAVGMKATASCFYINAGRNILKKCLASGNTTSYGFFINGKDIGLLEECTSTGNQTSGFYLETGSSQWVIKECASGAGDGKWRDIDHANVWNGFSYDEWEFNGLTLDASNTTKSYNIFQVTGIVRIKKIQAHVETVLSANHTNCFIDIYDGSSVPLSKNTTLTLNAAPVGSLLIKNAAVASVLDYQSGANAFLSESSFNKPEVEFVVGQKGDGTNTYIRFTHTTTDTPSSGVIHWHVQWEPVSDDGFIIEV